MKPVGPRYGDPDYQTFGHTGAIDWFLNQVTHPPETKHTRYNRSEKGRARRRRYARSSKGIAAAARVQLRKLGVEE